VEYYVGRLIYVGNFLFMIVTSYFYKIFYYSNYLHDSYSEQAFRLYNSRENNS